MSDLRKELVSCCLERAPVGITYSVEDVECVIVGRVVKVTPRHAIVAETRSNSSPIFIDSILKLERLDGGKGAELEEPTPATSPNGPTPTVMADDR